MRASVKERVVDIVQRILGPGASLQDGKIELESVKMLELVVALEQEFGIHIPEEAPLRRITSSVDSLVAYINKLKP